MSRNLADLQAECRLLNLTVVQTGKRESKADFEKALREHVWSKHCEDAEGDNALMFRASMG